VKARTIDLRQTSHATLKAATRTERAVGDFCRRALVALAPLLNGSPGPAARLGVDGEAYAAAAYEFSRIEARVAAARESVWLRIRSPGGLTIRLAETADYAFVTVNAAAPARDRVAVAATGDLLSDALQTLACGVELVEGHVHNEAEWLAHCIQHGVIDAYGTLTDLAWRHVIPATVAVAADGGALDGVRTLPNGSLWTALPGQFDEPPTASTRALREATIRALFPARDVAAYADDLAARAGWLAPVAVRWDEDLDDVLLSWVSEIGYPYGHACAQAWSDRTPDVTAWRPAAEVGAQPRLAPGESLPILGGHGPEALAPIHERWVAGPWPPRSAGLPDIDRAAALGGLNGLGPRVMFAADVDPHVLLALGMYLGEVLVNELGGAWLVPSDLPQPPRAGWSIANLPFEQQCRVGVVVGAIVVYPFEQARLLVERQGGADALALEASFTKLFRCVRRWREEPPSIGTRERSPETARLPPVLEPRAVAACPEGLVAVATSDAIHVFGAFHMDESTLVATCLTPRPQLLAFAGPDLLVSTGDGAVSLWDARSGRLLKTHATGRPAVTQLVAAGADLIAFATEAGRIGVVTPDSDGPTLLRPAGRPVGAVALTEDGDVLFAAQRSAIVQFDIGRGVELGRFGVGRATALACAADELGFATETGQVGVLDIGTGTLTAIGQVETIARAMSRGGRGWVVITDDAASVLAPGRPVRIDLPPGPPRWHRSICLVGDDALVVNTATGAAYVVLQPAG
jgi:hypothetical protein